jgi:hypothetical protein
MEEEYMEKANGGTFARTTRNTDEDDRRHDAKQVRRLTDNLFREWNGPFLLGDGGENRGEAAIWLFPFRAKTEWAAKGSLENHD